MQEKIVLIVVVTVQFPVLSFINYKMMMLLTYNNHLNLKN